MLLPSPRPLPFPFKKCVNVNERGGGATPVPPPEKKQKTQLKTVVSNSGVRIIVQEAVITGVDRWWCEGVSVDMQEVFPPLIAG